MRKSIVVVLLSLSGIACTRQISYSSIQPTSGGSWGREEIMEFTVQDPDTVQQQSLYILLRNDNTYPYSNLFLIVEMTYPDGTSQRDTLEYEMADAEGHWLGSGSGSAIENKLGYRKDVVFPAKGVYTFTVSQAMRKNGSVEGIESLPGVLDVGLQIEKNE